MQMNWFKQRPLALRMDANRKRMSLTLFGFEQSSSCLFEFCSAETGRAELSQALPIGGGVRAEGLVELVFEIQGIDPLEPCAGDCRCCSRHDVRVEERQCSVVDGWMRGMGTYYGCKWMGRTGGCNGE